MSTKMYNKTQLNPETTFERHVFHRDQFAHYLRWSHILKISKIGMNILDYGCGSGNLAEVLYRNRHKCSQYLGIDIRAQTICSNNTKFINVPWIKFEAFDLCGELPNFDTEWDIICCFEVLEHVGKKNGRQFLQNIKNCMSRDTILLLSTPVYNENVGAAANHIIDGEIGEYSYTELKELLELFFEVEAVYGTFASQKDYLPGLNETQRSTFDQLHKYYDSNLISVIMAPIIPPWKARNCLWRLKLK